jgi:transcriptional/translational regulatory protein YebC/TACO1
MFDRKGLIYLPAESLDEDKTLEAALEAGASDFEREGDQFVVSTEPADLHAVKSALESGKVPIAEVEIAWIPKNTVKVEGEVAESVLKLVEELEDLDDVQKVDANFDMDVEEMAQS